jgi:hypothetical protein
MYLLTILNKSIMKIYKNTLKTLFVAGALMSVTLLSGCKDDDPKKEDTPELITKATLTFTPIGGGAPVVASATDPDGEGVQDIVVDGAINLAIDTDYTLTLTLINELAEPTDPAYDITAEVEEEGAEHMFFYSWTNNVFSNPTGNGNIDNRADGMNYNDSDENGLPVGLSTNWSSATSTASGTFRVLLKHQPDLKSTTSDSNTGETDLDITFTLNIQ